MIETQARVVAAEAGYAVVEPRPHTPCGHCDPGTGCRSLAIARAFSAGPGHFRVRNPLDAAVGDWVTVSMAEAGVRNSALLMYLLPLGGLLGGALALAPLGEFASVSGGLAGLALTLPLVRRQAGRWQLSQDYQPVITGKLNPQHIKMERTCRSKN